MLRDDRVQQQPRAVAEGRCPLIALRVVRGTGPFGLLDELLDPGVDVALVVTDSARYCSSAICTHRAR